MKVALKGNHFDIPQITKLLLLYMQKHVNWRKDESTNILVYAISVCTRLHLGVQSEAWSYG